MENPLTQDCPYCGCPMAVTRMSCGKCRVEIEADFPMSRLGTLPVEHQRFIEMFVLAGGNLKEIAEQVAALEEVAQENGVDLVLRIWRQSLAQALDIALHVPNDENGPLAHAPQDKSRALRCER